MESIVSFLKGKETISNLISAPFHYIHELYRIIFERNEERMKREEEEKKKVEAEEKEAQRKSPRKMPNIPQRNQPMQKQKENKQKALSTMSPYEAEELEDALEELTEGGMI